MKLRQLLLPVFAAPLVAGAANLVILHTNDTHSQIEPTDSDRGGILRRKVLIDSVRAAEPDVLLVDCGDMVQGSLYFTLYGGEAEQRLMNALGYDIQILGNHEFDNGVDSLAAVLAGLDAELLTTNYRLDGTRLEPLFKQYTVRTFGDRRIGIMGLNLDPKGMIADDKAVGVVYLPAVEAANAMAWYLRNVEKCDAVVALTHVGYDTANPPTPADTDLAAATRGIDMFIGGHSHTEINPANPGSKPWQAVNLDGDTVLVVQTGARGESLGLIDFDLDRLKPVSYRLLPVDSRLDDRIDPAVAEILSPYKEGVERLRVDRIGRMGRELPAGSHLLVNWVADVMYEMGKAYSDRPVDLALVNKGGIRRGLPAGAITRELIMTMLPFDNKLVVMDISGADLKEALDVFARKNGDGISAGFDPASIDPARTYRLVTIDYLAGGGDYLTSLKRGTIVARSPKRLDTTMIDYLLSTKKTIKPTDSSARLKP